MHERRRLVAAPDWAAWNPAVAARPWTVGIEEEVLLVDPRDWTIANRIDDVLAAVPPNVASHATAETHACVLELRTAPQRTAGAAADELADLRQSLEAALRDRLGLLACAAGMHPLATAPQVSVSERPRHREIAATTRALAHREPTLALHVHVAVPDPAAAVRALDGLRIDLPVLLALGANSPFWRGSDSGFASMRVPIFSMFPRTGIARRFGTYAEYVRSIEPLLRGGAIPEPGFLWWDARLQPRLGTIEVRIMDAQTHVRDVAALAALVQCLVVCRAATGAGGPVRDEVLAENRFLAARDGMQAAFVDELTGARRPAQEVLRARLELCARIAGPLGCARELADVVRLADAPGYVRQRVHAHALGVPALPAWLAMAFAQPGRLAAVA